MRYKSTLLLLAAVVIAGIVAYSLSRKPSSEELQKLRKRLLADMESHNIEMLTIEAGQERLVCLRDTAGDGWRVAEPVQVRADRWDVEGILDKLELAEKVSSIFPSGEETLDLAQYDLDEPVRKVTLSENRPGGRTWTVLIGREAGIADSVYVAVEGEGAVYAVKKDVADKTDVTLTDVRSKRLAARISAFDMEKVAVTAADLHERPGFELACEKSDGKWELREPVYDLADSGKVQALANRLYDHRIGDDDFIVDDPTQAAAYGLDDPVLTLTIGGDGKTQTIVFSRRQEEDAARYYALHKGEPTIVRVPESLFNDLRKEPGELRERSLADFMVADVAEVAVDGPDVGLVLRKEEGAWEIAAETPVAADADLTDQVLRDLRDAEVEEFAADDAEDLTPYGLSEEARTRVTLKDEDGEILAGILLGAPDETAESVYAQRPPYPTVLSVRKESYLDKIATGRLAFLERLVLEESRDDAREVSLERGTARFRCAWNDTENQWDLAAPVEGEADNVAVRAIVGDLSHLRAEAFAAEHAEDLAAFGLDSPEISASVTYQAATEETEEEEAEAQPPIRVRTLYIGAAADEPAEGRFAKLADDDRVFVLPDYVVRHFRADLASKRISRAFDIAALTFKKDDEVLQFSYDDEQDLWTDAEGNALPEGTAEAVKGAARVLRNFTGVEVADYSDKEPALYGFDSPRLVVELQEEDKGAEQVVIGKETGDGNCYAKGPATRFVLIADKTDVEKLLAVLKEPAEAAPAPETPQSSE